MTYEMELGFGETPDMPETPLARVASGGVPTPPWQDGGELDMTGGNIIADVIAADSAPEEELEVYKKAERFKKLKLVSGNTVTGNLDKYIFDNYGVTGKQRLSLARHVMSVLGYRPSADVLLMLSCTNKARVVIATAGAGKTTSLQVEILIDKMLDKALQIGELTPELESDSGLESSVP